MEGYIYTKEDYSILESYKTLVDSLADYLGYNCELVLHSFEDVSHSIIYIANGHVTNRHIGSPITNIGIKMASEISDKTMDLSYRSYFTESLNGKVIKSNSTAIKNAEGIIIGMLCINWDIEISFLSMLKTFVAEENKTDSKRTHERFSENVNDIIQDAIKNAALATEADDTSAATYNKTVIKRLYQQGIFEFKESVQAVATYLKISHHTVYLHIRAIKNRTHNNN